MREYSERRGTKYDNECGFQHEGQKDINTKIAYISYGIREGPVSLKEDLPRIGVPRVSSLIQAEKCKAPLAKLLIIN